MFVTHNLKLKYIMIYFYSRERIFGMLWKNQEKMLFFLEKRKILNRIVKGKTNVIK